MQVTKRRRIFEIVAVLVTAAGKFVFMDFLDWKLPFILAAFGGWTGYVIYQSRRSPGILRHWGFRKDNFREVLYKLLPFGVISIVSFVLVGILRDTLNLTWHIVPILLLYPLWGTIQQFLLIALVAGNWQDLKNTKSGYGYVVFISALLFGVIHYPYYWLMAGTFLLALLYGFIYLRSRNIFVLGIFHGWLGAIFFYTVVARDPFAEIFGKIASP